MKLAAKHTQRRPRGNLRLIGIALALTGTALGAHGAGLGRLNVLSSIGQPLRAEIELTSVTRDETPSLTARLASPDAFKQASIDYGAALTGLRFSIQRRADGQPYVLVTSSQLLNEPFLDVLVELQWNSGRLIREYTLLIDPPNVASSQTAAPAATVLPARTPTAGSRTRLPLSPSNETTGGAASAARAPAAAGVGAGSAGGGDYLVRSGDTAISIAREYKPDGVSLEQMLATLYRDNAAAFTGNINRLTAGATMKIPDAATARSVDAGEVRRIVAQSANFGTYRDRIARNATLAPTARESGQQASGRLTTQVEDSAAPAADAKDRLQLSRPDSTKAAAASGGTRSGIGGPSADELAAKDRELVETKTRLALLEKNVADLQKLLELKSQSLAELQKTNGGRSDVATTTPSTAVSPAVATTAVTTTAGAAATTATTPPDAASASNSTGAVAPQTAAAVVTPATMPAPIEASPAAALPAPAPVKATSAPVKPIAPVAESNWYDSMLENSLLLAGLIGLLLLLVGYGIFTARRRRSLANFEDSIFVDNSVLHANSVFGTTGGQSVDTANSGFHSNFVPVAGNLPEQNEVDPVAEADVYIAYGRDAQAEEILKEALRADASRPAVRLKLLEIYVKRGDAKTFETMASELYASTGGQGPDWAQAAALGLTIDPHNPLYAEVPEVAAPPPMYQSPTPQSTPAQSTASQPMGVQSLAAATRQGGQRDPAPFDAGLGATGLGLSDFGVEPESEDHQVSTIVPVAHMRTDPLPRPDFGAATSAPSMDLDFDLGFANTGMTPLSTDVPATIPSPPAAVDPASKSNGLDFDVGTSNLSLIEPFTASAFGSGDSSARTAVNLPAFRARAEKDAEKDAEKRPEHDGFSASDIFGSSIVADGDAAPDDDTASDSTTPVQARTQDFRNVVDNHQFDKTEPLDAFSKINLDLDQGGYESTAVAPDYGTRTDVWQAMATKLDLALAYSDIGDKDGARELLEEVVRNGDSAQAGRARTLIGELG